MTSAPMTVVEAGEFLKHTPAIRIREEPKGEPQQGERNAMRRLVPALVAGYPRKG